MGQPHAAHVPRSARSGARSDRSKPPTEATAKLRPTSSHVRAVALRTRVRPE